MSSSIRAPIVGLATALGLAIAPAAAGAAAPGPRCLPSGVEASALRDGAVTLSPLPGSLDASPGTQISLLGLPAREIGPVVVVGSRTGLHTGRLEAYSQGDGASFVPARPFLPGERVRVSATVTIGGAAQPLTDSFVIASPDAITATPETIHPGVRSEVQVFNSRPDLHPPAVTVTEDEPGASSGDIFIAPYTGPGQAGPMILDPQGHLLWFRPLPAGESATNLQVQRYHGRPVLTWWQGDITVHGFGLGEDEIYDTSYRPVAVVRAGNGRMADLHDFRLTPQGTALITSYAPVLCDLAAVDGPARGGIVDATFQEVDVRTGLVMYEWTSLDHVAVGESYERLRADTLALPYDYFHINSINLNEDGTLMISARNTWTVYDIDPATGLIEWRLGGRRSSFQLGPGVQTAWQHDPRQLPGGEISIFDNGSDPTVHPQSRGIVVSLDAAASSAALVQQFTHPSPLVSESQGNLQALPGGDWFVGWGQVPDFSEFSPAGSLLFDARLPEHDQSYRSFRFPWSASPPGGPAIALRRSRRGVVVYASWNGATAVTAWRVMAGRSRRRLDALAGARRRDFETAIAVHGAVPAYVEAQALDATGAVIGVSPVVRG